MLSLPFTAIPESTGSKACTSHSVDSSRALRRRGTRPVSALQMLLLLLPLWWLLGIEQLVWPVGLILVLVHVLSHRRYRVFVTPTVVWLLVFILVYLISGLFIVETFRVLTFVRGLSAYLSAILLVLIVTNSVESVADIRRIILAVVLVMGVASTVGFLAISGVFRPSFGAPVGLLLPNSIESTSYGARIAHKELGSQAWFAWTGTYYRTRSFFMYGTLYATALMATIPMSLLMLRHTSSRSGKVLLVFFTVAMVVNLLFTTARIAILSLLFGAGYYYLIVRPERRPFTLLLFLGLLLLLVSLLIAVETTQSWQDLLGASNSIFDSFWFARGGSSSGRLSTYLGTLESFRDRPVFGWGTERDMPGLPLPAGSHSYYLGTLYKQGVIGFMLLLATGVSVWVASNPNRARARGAVEFESDVLQYGRWILVALAVNSSTDVLDLDAITFVLVWTILAAMIAVGYGRYKPDTRLSHG